MLLPSEGSAVAPPSLQIGYHFNNNMYQQQRHFVESSTPASTVFPKCPLFRNSDTNLSTYQFERPNKFQISLDLSPLFLSHKSVSSFALFLFLRLIAIISDRNLSRINTHPPPSSAYRQSPTRRCRCVSGLTKIGTPMRRNKNVRWCGSN